MSLLEKSSKINVKIEWLFIFFIILQPILDISAFFGFPFSIGVRALAMLFGFFYILLYPESKYKKSAIFYLFILGIFMVINFIINFTFKANFVWIDEVEYIIKTSYVILMLVTYIFVFRRLSSRVNWENIIQRNISIALAIIGIAMFIAELTGSGRRSYRAINKEGHSGWFFSANELSAILAMGLGILLLYFISTKISTKLILLPFLLLVTWSMLTIGTKVGLGAMLIILIVTLLITIMDVIRNRKKWINIVFIGFVTIVSLLIIPYTSVQHNLDIKVFNWFGHFTEDPSESDDIEQPEEEQKPNPVEQGELSQALLSGRGDFLINHWNQYKQAPVQQKLFGMGYGGNYESSPKLVEMDFFDYFFSFGVVGFIILILPFLAIGFLIIKNIFVSKFKLIRPVSFLLIVEIGLGLGIASIAGHIFSAPSSGYYFVLLISYLYAYTSHFREKLFNAY
ncbi:O-antigen ligase like membrane protein [Salinibacillus kushneri]|uniref:O-antigen ligase like membrane protein n=1 Tax=Salinibacillus kushneri TaxID=237682 RepID=A0A1I0D0A0_9BACI|nr:O-antigen ligase family protein [Salinibacillus kushneri]SET25561.1 O-antigen ligase like membrane protein [Salinibacillus kushneri]